MSHSGTSSTTASKGRLLARNVWLQLLAFVPATVLAGIWFGIEAAAVIGTLALPAFVIRKLGAPAPTRAPRLPIDGLTGLSLRQELVDSMDSALSERRENGLSTACLVVEVDEFQSLVDRRGHSASEALVKAVAHRLRDTMRDADVIARMDGATFAILLSPVRNADLEAVIQISSRLQSALGEPMSIDGTTVYISCSIGFCLSSRTPEDTGIKMLIAAESALIEARRNGPGAIRSYSREMKKRLKDYRSLLEEVRVGLELGQISAWYQPQVSTDSGEVTGFEALARWTHPDRGLIPPGEFLPALEEVGLLSRLGEVMLYNALNAIRNWDRAGLEIPSVAVNFSAAELGDPKLMEKVRWELDRFDLTPDRLTIEVLENVVAELDDDTIPRNLRALSDLGCKIDLDDFGTGQASIASMRRFAVNRIKIDRSFVTKIDEDPEQQKMLSAILMMAERLDLETLAEGVESLGERSVLAQLGCSHIQGFGVARPMPFEDTLAWVPGHRSKLTQARNAGQRIG
ncbi:MAG: bifunctional diguanylate cyclase/phosphodiesterase [Pseudomonadota bacterium]